MMIIITQHGLTAVFIMSLTPLHCLDSYSFVVDILVVPHMAQNMSSVKCQDWRSKFGETETQGINNPISESENDVIIVV